MTEHRSMRASDTDRAQVAEQLRRATIEGRLRGDEFDERLGQALDARTYGELDTIVADLPRQHDVVRPGRARARLRRRPRPFASATVTVLHHHPRPLTKATAAGSRVWAVIRRRPMAIASSVAATGAAVATAGALLASPTVVPLAAQRIPVHGPERATCDHNGTEVACKICNPNGFVVQHGTISVPIDKRCTARDRRPMPGEVRPGQR